MKAAVLLVALASSAGAHHGHFYDECRRITIEGRVESVEFKNPHNLFVLRLDNGTAYTVDWINVTWMTRAGILSAAKAAVVPGARVAVAGYRIRDAAGLEKVAPKFKGTVDPNTVEARSLRRVDDSFTWGVPPSTTVEQARLGQPSCP
jgi:hypothetical protein